MVVKKTETELMALIHQHQTTKRQYKDAKYEHRLANKALAREARAHPDECLCVLCKFYWG